MLGTLEEDLKKIEDMENSVEVFKQNSKHFERKCWGSED